MSLAASALRHPFRPVQELGSLQADGRAAVFAVVVGVVICALAGARAYADHGLQTGLVRFSTSLGGFVLLSAAALGAGRALGGRGRLGTVAAAVVGSGIPFVAIDALWLVVPSPGPAAQALTVLERLSWAWALVLLVLGLSAAHGFSRVRAGGTVLIVAAVVAALVAAALLARDF